jgi:hypothetical protein
MEDSPGVLFRDDNPADAGYAQSGFSSRLILVTTVFRPAGVDPVLEQVRQTLDRFLNKRPADESSPIGLKFSL